VTQNEFWEGVMKLPRRRFLHLAASAAALPMVSRSVWAQVYPTRPVRIIVGFPAGGGSDLVARVIGQLLSERLGQQFIIENRPGAAGNIATETVVRASPDGYTLLFSGSGDATNATVYRNLRFNFIRDMAPVASISKFSNVFLVRPSFPAKTVPELISYAKANPGRINMASPGIGTPPHLAGELFKMTAGIDMTHVPYRGGAPLLTDLMGGQIQFGTVTLAGGIEHIRAGTLRALAVTGAGRAEVLPDIPAVSEFVPGFEASGWFGISAPKNTPIEIINTLNREINAGLGDPRIRDRIIDLGSVPLSLPATEFRKLIVDDTEKWGKVIRAANIKGL
jgi:tripartite-type tricarboxylate transporter receptor subunit TctC